MKHKKEKESILNGNLFESPCTMLLLHRWVILHGMILESQGALDTDVPMDMDNEIEALSEDVKNAARAELKDAQSDLSTMSARDFKEELIDRFDELIAMAVERMAVELSCLEGLPRYEIELIMADGLAEFLSGDFDPSFFEEEANDLPPSMGHAIPFPKKS